MVYAPGVPSGEHTVRQGGQWLPSTDPTPLTPSTETACARTVSAFFSLGAPTGQLQLSLQLFIVIQRML